MRLVIRRSVVITAALLLVAASASLVACGGGADPYSGTWIGPTLGPSPEPGTHRFEFVIKPARDGWWSIATQGQANPTYAAEMHGQLETPNAGMVFKRSGDKLKLTMLGVPIELTKK